MMCGITLKRWGREMGMCFYLAERIKRCLPFNDPQQMLAAIGPARSDVDEDGTLRSDTKTIDLLDYEGARYRITISKV